VVGIRCGILLERSEPAHAEEFELEASAVVDAEAETEVEVEAEAEAEAEVALVVKIGPEIDAGRFLMNVFSGGMLVAGIAGSIGACRTAEENVCCR
jgi:hypothetical protein